MKSMFNVQHFVSNLHGSEMSIQKFKYYEQNLSLLKEKFKQNFLNWINFLKTETNSENIGEKRAKYELLKMSKSICCTTSDSLLEVNSFNMAWLVIRFATIFRKSVCHFNVSYNMGLWKQKSKALKQTLMSSRWNWRRFSFYAVVFFNTLQLF